MGKLIITGIEKKDNPQLVGGVFVVATPHKKEEPQCGSYTSGVGVECGPQSYVSLETHDDRHPLIGRGLDRNLGVASRREAIILQGAVMTPLGLVGLDAKGFWNKARPTK